MLSLKQITTLATRQAAVVTVAVENNSIRQVHSNRQIKRIFKGPAKLRIEKRMNLDRPILPRLPDQVNFEPVYTEFTMLSNGWSAPPGPDFELPPYPFAVTRTRNKPNDAVGFLPVYSKLRKDGTKVTTRIRKVSGDQEAFLQEIRAVLGIPPPIPGKSSDDPVRVRTGGTIEIQGNHVRQIKEWLAGLGF